MVGGETARRLTSPRYSWQNQQENPRGEQNAPFSGEEHPTMAGGDLK